MNNFMLTDTSIIEDQDNSRAFYPFYVGIAIGSNFHVAACIPFEKFRSEKEWKRSKTMKFNSDSQGITKFIHALEDIQTQFEYKPQDFFILLEPTGGYYSYLVVRVLLDRGYSIDKQIASLLYGNKEEGYKPHPYTKILMSFPIMSESMACTFIGAIGDIERFSTYLEPKKYLGVAAENKISGTSVFKSRQTYEGVRDTRRVLFLMTLLLISSKISEIVFVFTIND
ncbi:MULTISPECIES: transposase [Paenibacillus]|uniref:transposase n=1 Tax=Paenibacillus TaxID=44249 RepID=UPI002ED50803|nr:transposase [Paenibacillus polymyxa]